MHRALLRHMTIGQSCVQGGRHLLPFHAEEESWKPAVLDSPASLTWGGRGSTRDQRITKSAILTAPVHAGNCLYRTVFDCFQALVTSQQLVANPDHCR